VTGTPSRLTFALFAVNKICVIYPEPAEGICATCPELVEGICGSMSFIFSLWSLWPKPLRAFVANFVFCPLLIYFQSQEVQKKCSKHAQNLLISVSFCSERACFC
jgi:hypothetical protein